MRFITSVALAIALAPSLALAKGGKPWSHPHGPGGPSGSFEQPAKPGRAAFVSRDHTIIQQYYAGTFGRGCPPGLAKKQNGCLPPGHAKRWVVGQPLATGIVWHAVPHELLVRLSAPPVGFRYIYLDRAVLLFNPATRFVADGVAINVNIR